LTLPTIPDLFPSNLYDPPKWPIRIPRPPGGDTIPPSLYSPRFYPPKFPRTSNHSHWPHWPGHRRGHPHFKHTNHTIYEFLASSTQHQYLYNLIENDTTLIDMFNTAGRDGKITLFAPTDGAFEKVLKHPTPKWLLKSLVKYYTANSFYPAERLLTQRTIPTLFQSNEPFHSTKLRINVGFNGVTINYYSHPVFFYISTSNGVVHAIDNLLLPPPPVYQTLRSFPSISQRSSKPSRRLNQDRNSVRKPKALGRYLPPPTRHGLKSHLQLRRSYSVLAEIIS